MHCIVPFAAPAASDGEAGKAALASMQWPRLAALLLRLAEVDRDEGEPTSFTPPHERVLARALGWRGEDGRWPFAARAARADGIAVGEEAWGLVTPVHWHVGTDQVSLVDPGALQLDEPTSRAFFEAVRPLFADFAPGAAAQRSPSQPARFEWGAPSRWYVAHASLEGLRTASLDRVAGRNVDPWLVQRESAADRGADRGADGDAVHAPWRRLQAEVQMLLHDHPLNAEREAKGLLPVNSFWLSGCGRAQPEPPQAHVQLDETLRESALAEDWTAWAAAWRRLEESTLLGLDVALRRGADIRLTLAGERAAVTYAPQRGGIVARLRGLVARPAVPALLGSL